VILHIATKDVKLNFGRGSEPASFCQAWCRHDTYINNVLLRQYRILVKSELLPPSRPSACLSVPSVCSYSLQEPGFRWRDFHKIWYWWELWKSVEKA